MTGKPPRCPRSNCGRFLEWKAPSRGPGYWWCPRCARRVSPNRAGGHPFGQG